MSEFERAKKKLVGINKTIQGPRPKGKHYGVSEVAKNDDLQFLMNEVRSLKVDILFLKNQNAKLVAALQDALTMIEPKQFPTGVADIKALLKEAAK